MHAQELALYLLPTLLTLLYQLFLALKFTPCIFQYLPFFFKLLLSASKLGDFFLVELLDCLLLSLQGLYFRTSKLFETFSGGL